MTDVAILLYDRITALDAVGPYEVLRSVPGISLSFVGKTVGPKRTDAGSLALMADYALEKIKKASILVVPGGPGQEALMNDQEVLDWICQIHQQSKWTTSVCTGSLVLGAAGLLKGVSATSHWLALQALQSFGAKPVAKRVVKDGKIMTAAGVSAGIDMALTLVGAEYGDEVAKSIQLVLEYDPQPPYHAGSPQKVDQKIVETLRSRSRFHL